MTRRRRYGWQSQPRDLLGRFGSIADEGSAFDDRMRAYLPCRCHPRGKPQRYPDRAEFESSYHLMAREYWREPMPK